MTLYASLAIDLVLHLRYQTIKESRNSTKTEKKKLDAAAMLVELFPESQAPDPFDDVCNMYLPFTMSCPSF